MAASSNTSSNPVQAHHGSVTTWRRGRGQRTTQHHLVPAPLKLTREVQDRGLEGPLEGLALAVAALDEHCLALLRGVWEHGDRLGLSLDNQEPGERASWADELPSLDSINEMAPKLRGLRQRQLQFHESYLDDGNILKIWRPLQVCSTMAAVRTIDTGSDQKIQKSSNLTDQFYSWSRNTNYAMENLQNALDETIEHQQLSKSAARNIQERLQLARAIQDFWFTLFEMDKFLVPLETLKLMERNLDRYASRLPALQSQPEHAKPGPAKIDIVLGLTATNTLISLLCTVFGFQYCDNLKGTWHDTDFWFLLQSTTCQLVGIITAMLSSGVTIRPSLSKQFLLSIMFLFAVLAAILSVPLYLVMSTKWSSLCVVYSSLIQSFILLKLATTSTES